MSDKTTMLDFDDARKEKFSRVSSKVVDLLKAEMESPLEAYALLQFVRESFEHIYGIKGTIVYKVDKVGHA